MWYLAVFGIAYLFYYIGDNEYHRKGGLLAGISVVLSFGITLFTPLAFFGVVAINLLFFIGIWIFNLISRKPPRSSSGF